MDLAESLEAPDVQAALKALPPEKRLAYLWRLRWLQTAHAHQVLPSGDWWSIWLMLAGRGAGKTRTAAEQIGWWAWENPGTRWLVAAPTSSDVRSTCFEGDSGLMAVIPAPLIDDYNKALHELRLTNGSLIKGIPASEPERFRGPQFHGAWCCIPGTMIATPDGQRPIETLRPGDVVLTRHGPRRVLAAGPSGNPADLVRLDCGETSLTVTEDHPILVGDQWVAAGDVKEGALVWATSTSAAGTRTASSMSGTTGRSLLAGWFITATATLATTTSRTLRRCLGLSTTGCTRPASRLRTLRRRLQRLLWPSCALPRMDAAFSAAPGLSPWPLGGWVPSVLASARSGGGATCSGPSSGPVRSAAARTSRRSDSSGTAAGRATTDPRCGPIAVSQLAVRRVERLPNALTYNLTVEGEHEFIANGIVVHNCDELAAWDYLQESWDQIQFGVRLGAKTRTIITTTPKPKDLIIELLAREGDDVVVTRASTYANLGNLSDNFRRQIMQYEGTTLGRQEIHAEIIDPEEGGIVKRDSFKLWPAQKAFPRFEYILQSYDCATSEKTQNDPTASSTWGVFKPEDGPMSAMLIDCWQDRLQYPDLRPKVVDEYETVFESGTDGRDRKRVDLILIEDKSAGISLIQDLQRAHLPVRAYNPGKADKVQRLNIVSHIIARGRVWIPESTQRPGYVRDWAEPLVSQVCAFPQTTHDDLVDTCVDALTQVQMAVGTKAIKDIKVGDMVMTPAGPRKVTAVHDNGLQEVWDVDGLLATAEHKVMTQRGWTRVDCLTQGVDNVFLYQEGTSCRLSPRAGLLRLWCSTVESIGATLKAATRRIVGTSHALARGFIEMCGSSIMGRYPMACTSITSTETPPTTTSPTLRASVAKNTWRNTERSGLGAIAHPSSLLCLSASGQHPQNGTDLKREGRGTGSTLRSLWQRLGASQKSSWKSHSSASGAASKHFESRSAGSSADTLARLQSHASVLVSRAINTHTMRHVFDLTVEGEHCYYANGVLVHNCTQALRFLRDSGWLEVDPPPQDDWDEDDYADTGRPKRENPYAA